MFVWAKGKPTQVLPIAEVLKGGELNKGVTVAVQTLNKESLDAIKRSNITEKNLQESLNLYEDKNVPTYLDFVMGLPKETLDTFKKGITADPAKTGVVAKKRRNCRRFSRLVLLLFDI